MLLGNSSALASIKSPVAQLLVEGRKTLGKKRKGEKKILACVGEGLT